MIYPFSFSKTLLSPVGFLLKMEVPIPETAKRASKFKKMIMDKFLFCQSKSSVHPQSLTERGKKGHEILL